MYAQPADAPRRKPVTVPGLRAMKARDGMRRPILVPFPS